MALLRNLFGKKQETSSPSGVEPIKSGEQPTSSEAGSAPDSDRHDQVDHSHQDIQRLIAAQGFAEPEAVMVAKVVGEVRKWYGDRARSYSGRFGGTCDDCSRPLGRNDFYLTGSNSGICETCLGEHLFTHIKWEIAVQNLQQWIGTSSVRVPQNLLSVADEAAKFIMSYRTEGKGDNRGLKEVERAIGRPLVIVTKGEFEKGARLEDGFVVELVLTPENFWTQGNLTTIPAVITQMPRLRRLEIINHRLDSIPDAIGEMANLEILNLNRNSLTGLPSRIGDLPKLRSLSLYANQIVSLPESLWGLPSLEELILSSNQLTSLSEQIGSSERLKRLVLNSNNLCSLPASLVNFPNLRKLEIENNPQLLETSMSVITTLREKGCEVCLGRQS